jgi:V-type H+-transporting ATPase subunit D
MQTRLIGAKKGHSLLKKKSDAMSTRFRKIEKELNDKKCGMGETFKTSSYSLTEARFHAGDITNSIMESVSSASFKVRIKGENIAGIFLPIFLPVGEEQGIKVSGIARGGEYIVAAKKQHQNTLRTLVDIASLQSSFVTLDKAIRVTNRRVNALDRVVIPKVENTIAYIKDELDELSREEFFRLKKVRNKKIKDAAAKQKLLEEKVGAEEAEKIRSMQNLESSQGMSENQLFDTDGGKAENLGF